MKNRSTGVFKTWASGTEVPTVRFDVPRSIWLIGSGDTPARRAVLGDPEPALEADLGQADPIAAGACLDVGWGDPRPSSRVKVSPYAPMRASDPRDTRQRTRKRDFTELARVRREIMITDVTRFVSFITDHVFAGLDVEHQVLAPLDAEIVLADAVSEERLVELAGGAQGVLVCFCARGRARDQRGGRGGVVDCAVWDSAWTTWTSTLPRATE